MWQDCYDGRKTMLIVIDGYNLIFAVTDLERHVRVNNIEDARERLISLLIRYKASKKYNIILVFDSSHDCFDMPSRQEISGLEIVYAKYSKDADTEIKNIIAHSQNPKDTLVVTNDNDIRNYVKKKGGNVLDSAPFYNEVAKTLGWQKRTLPKEYKSKFEGPSKTETEYWLDVFKEEKSKHGTANKPFKADQSSKKSTHNEPLSKYLGPSADETDYWLQFFKEKRKEDK